VVALHPGCPQECDVTYTVFSKQLSANFAVPGSADLTAQAWPEVDGLPDPKTPF